MQGLDSEDFLIDDARQVAGHFFEYTDRKNPVKPGVNLLKAVLHVATEEAVEIKSGVRIRRLATGVLYLVKEVDVSGVGIVSVDLERASPGKESLGMGKF